MSITVQAAGPVRPRTKYKVHKLLRGEGNITLPFVPFAGLFLTFSKQKRKGESITLYLRVRAVEWSVAENRFNCTADEILGSPLFLDAHEVRGGARIEQHFVELERSLRTFGFEVVTDADGMTALHKCEDGTTFESRWPV